MDTNPLFAYLPFLAVLAPFALFWNQVKALILKIFGIFIIKTEFNNTGTLVFINYLSNNAKKYRLSQFGYDADMAYTTKDKRHVTIGYEVPTKMPQIYKVGHSFFVGRNGWEPNGQNGCNMTIYSLRWTVNIEKLYIKALKEYNNGLSQRRSFRIMFKSGQGKKSIISNKSPNAYGGESPEKIGDGNMEKWAVNRILEYTPEQIGYRDRSHIKSGYVFSKDAQIVMNECQMWKKSENWYKERGILWRRGIILTGVAGTGKSSLIRKICQTIDIPLIVFDLASMSNSEMIESWKDIQQYSPCAVIFDDIDRVFNGSTNMVGDQGGGLTLDCLLGCISGAMPAEGVLVFATVNDPKKLDPALGIIEDGRPTRPGRFDMIVELGKQAENDRRELAKMIFEGLTTDIEEIVKAGEGMTAAQFNDHCSHTAVNLYWKEKNMLDSQPKPCIMRW